MRRIWEGASRWNFAKLVTTFAFLLPVSLHAALPDLMVPKYRLMRSAEVVYRYFPPDDCAVVEGCVRAAGTRKLLLFDVSIANIGKGDAVIGDPAERPDLFEYSPCHGHMHIYGFAAYKLLKPNGRVLIADRKQGFCMRDEAPFLSSAPEVPHFNCDYQGITTGWQDIYDKSLECQWLDITGVRPGVYILRVKANPARIFPEHNFLNNVTDVVVRIP